MYRVVQFQVDMVLSDDISSSVAKNYLWHAIDRVTEGNEDLFMASDLEPTEDLTDEYIRLYYFDPETGEM